MGARVSFQKGSADRGEDPVVDVRDSRVQRRSAFNQLLVGLLLRRRVVSDLLLELHEGPLGGDPWAFPESISALDFSPVCARTTLSKKRLREVAEDFEAEFSEKDALAFRPRYSAAPSDSLWILRHAAARRVIAPVVWGGVARTAGVAWRDGPETGNRTVNSLPRPGPPPVRLLPRAVHSSSDPAAVSRGGT